MMAAPNDGQEVKQTTPSTTGRKRRTSKEEVVAPTGGDEVSVQGKKKKLCTNHVISSNIDINADHTSSVNDVCANEDAKADQDEDDEECPIIISTSKSTAALARIKTTRADTTANSRTSLSSSGAAAISQIIPRSQSQAALNATPSITSSSSFKIFCKIWAGQTITLRVRPFAITKIKAQIQEINGTPPHYQVKYFPLSSGYL
jgi:hypothetical protein